MDYDYEELLNILGKIHSEPAVMNLIYSGSVIPASFASLHSAFALPSEYAVENSCPFLSL